MDPEDIWAPGILDEDRDPTNRRDDEPPTPADYRDPNTDESDRPW